MTTHRNDGLPELPERYGPMGDAENGWIDGYTADQMREYGKACRRASPSVGGLVEKWLGDAAFYMASGENDKAVAYETCALELRAASPEPLLSREPEPVSNASVTVGGVRVPREVIRFLYGLGELDGVSFGDKHPTKKGMYWWRLYLQDAVRLAQEDRLNHAAEVGEVTRLALEIEDAAKDIDEIDCEYDRPETLRRWAERLRRLAGSERG